MLVRYPTFDLSTWSPQWGDNPEAVVIVNAGGIIPAAIERFLIRVMRQAKKLLDPATDAELIADIEIFNKQEGQHLKLHAEYLLWLRDNGYPRILEFEAGMTAGEVAVSVEREQAAWEGMAIAFGDTLNWVFQPGYDPAAVPAPRDYEAVLAMYAPAS